MRKCGARPTLDSWLGIGTSQTSLVPSASVLQGKNTANEVETFKDKTGDSVTDLSLSVTTLLSKLK